MTTFAEADLQPRVAALLSSDDEEARNQGVELLVALDDADLFDRVVGELATVTSDASKDWPLPGFDRLVCESLSLNMRNRSGTLLRLVADAPDGSAFAQKRDAARALSWSFDPLSAAPLDFFAKFAVLEDLLLVDVGRFEVGSHTWAPANLRRLVIHTPKGGNPPPSFLRCDIEELVVHYWSIAALDLSGLRALRSLEIRAAPQLTDLTGLDRLPNLVDVKITGLNRLSMASIEQLIALEVSTATGYRLRAKERASKGDYGGAVDDYTRAIERAPHDDAVYERRANARGRLGDTQGSIDDLTRAIEVSTTPKKAYFHDRAVDKMNLGDLPGSEDDFRAALALEPQAQNSLKGLAVVIGRQGKHEEAIIAYTHAIDAGLDEKSEIGCINNRGDKLMILGRLEAALDDFTRVLALNPSSVVGLFNRAETYLKLSRFDLCVRDANRCLELDPDIEDGVATRDEALRKLGTGVSAFPYESTEVAFRRFREDRSGRAAYDFNAVFESIPVAEFDAWLAGVRFVENGVRRCDDYYGALAVRPYPLSHHIAELINFDRYLLSHSPAGSRGRELCNAIDSLYIGDDTVDSRTLFGFSRLQRLWIEREPKASLEGLEALAIRTLGLGFAPADSAIFDRIDAMRSLEEIILPDWFDLDDLPVRLVDKVRRS